MISTRENDGFLKYLNGHINCAMVKIYFWSHLMFDSRDGWNEVEQNERNPGEDIDWRSDLSTEP